MNIDKRTRKTREILSKTLVHLLLEKPLSEITVTELTEASDLNRATFYLHYANIYDLFQSIEDELVEQVQSWINTAYPKDSNVFHLEYDKDGTPTLPVIAEVFNFIYSNRETTAVLLRNPESKLLDRIYSQGRDTILKFLLSQENSSDKIRIEFSLDYIISGCIGIIQSWIDKGLSISPKTMSQITCDLVLNNSSKL